MQAVQPFHAMQAMQPQTQTLPFGALTAAAPAQTVTMQPSFGTYWPTLPSGAVDPPPLTMDDITGSGWPFVLPFQPQADGLDPAPDLGPHYEALPLEAGDEEVDVGEHLDLSQFADEGMLA